MTADPSSALPRPGRVALYDEVVAAFGAALVRLARSYELDGDKRQDLLQDIHLALWTSLDRFDGACALRTWVYRVAHNVATTHAIKDRRHRARNFVTLEALESVADPAETDHAADRRMMLDQIASLLQQLNPLDRQVMLLYLEGIDAAAIGEITGFSAGNVATKVHRIKKILGRRVQRGGTDAD